MRRTRLRLRVFEGGGSECELHDNTDCGNAVEFLTLAVFQ